MKVIYYRRGAIDRWRFGLWRTSSSTALDIGPFRLMSRKAFSEAQRLSDWCDAA